MIVEDFIKWLQTQDQGATVDVMCRTYPRRIGGDTSMWVNFDPLKYSAYIDMRGNKFGIGTSYENSRTLSLGGDD